jgi:hypothetical protein
VGGDNKGPKTGEDDTEDDVPAKLGVDDYKPVPFEGVLDRGVPMVDLVSLESGDSKSQRALREALDAAQYWDVPANARVLTGPYWGGAECKIRTTTQRGFYSETSIREHYERANTVYRVQVDTQLGYWKVWLGDK